MYVNAWDEETYLTYQTSLGILARPGYFLGGLITLLFQLIGFSGAETNLLLDVFITPLTWLLAALSIQNFVPSSKSKIALACIVIFSPVLFNNANPLMLLTRDFLPLIFVYGAEGYASALRSPEPQLSLLLISIAIFHYSKTKRIFLILLIIPFLYPFTAICYAMIVFCLLSFDTKLYQKYGVIFVVFIALFIYFFISALFVLIEVFDLLNLYKAASPHHFSYDQSFKVPTMLLVLAPFWLIVRYFTAKSKNFIIQDMGFILILCLLLLSNIHLVSGYSISYKNFYDYGFGFIAGLLLVLYYLNLRGSQPRLVSKFFLFFVISLIFTFSLPLHWLSNREYRIWLSPQGIHKNDWYNITSSPSTIYIEDENLRGKIAYSVNKAVAPMFAYQYHFPDAGRLCSGMYLRMEDLIQDGGRFGVWHSGKIDRLAVDIFNITKTQQRSFFLPDFGLCDEFVFSAPPVVFKLNDSNFSWFVFRW